MEEQQLIPMTDVDDHDSDPDTVHVLGGYGTTAVGTVRLYRHSPSGHGGSDVSASSTRWKGDRLAVLRGHATALIGARLVRFAVSWAAAAGGDLMDAQVQMQNVRFFDRLGWLRAGRPAKYFGVEHQPMVFVLADARKLKLSDGPGDAHLELPARCYARSPLLGEASLSSHALSAGR